MCREHSRENEVKYCGEHSSSHTDATRDCPGMWTRYSIGMCGCVRSPTSRSRPTRFPRLMLAHEPRSERHRVARAHAAPLVTATRGRTHRRCLRALLHAAGAIDVTHREASRASGCGTCRPGRRAVGAALARRRAPSAARRRAGNSQEQRQKQLGKQVAAHAARQVGNTAAIARRIARTAARRPSISAARTARPTRAEP